jgi:hypothetical protein
MKRAFINGTVMTMDDENPLAEAVLTDGGTIVAAGSAEAVRRLSHGAEIVDLQGKRFCPASSTPTGILRCRAWGMRLRGRALCAAGED